MLILSFCIVFFLFLTWVFSGWFLAGKILYPKIRTYQEILASPAIQKRWGLTDYPLSPSAYHLPHSYFTYKSLRPGHPTLDALYIPGNSPTTIVFSHGFWRNHWQCLPLLSFFSELPYSLLFTDFPPFGHAPKAPSTLGIHESLDLKGLLTDFSTENPSSNFILYGFCMGGFASLLASLHFPSIKALVLDSSYPSPHSMVLATGKKIGYPHWLLQHGLLWFEYRTKLALSEYALPELNLSFPLPALLLYSHEDKMLPPSAPSLLSALFSHSLTRTVYFDKGEHTLLFQAQPALYTQSLSNFLLELPQ